MIFLTVESEIVRLVEKEGADDVNFLFSILFHRRVPPLRFPFVPCFANA